jgi:hypothetical protein
MFGYGYMKAINASMGQGTLLDRGHDCLNIRVKHKLHEPSYINKSIVSAKSTDSRTAQLCYALLN